MPDDKVKHAAPVPPFVRFVASDVPMVFDNSMSYYEALCGLWKYIQNNVINVINDNANVTEEYIKIVDDLKSYVENYFANLDVQEEINNKLDAMVEAGTLQEIITSYIQANVAWTFDTVADMKLSENLIAGSYARTLGFHSINDGGGATYYITDTGTANEMDIIAIDSLYANLVKPSVITPEMYGAYGDNIHDDTLAIQQLIDNNNNIYLSEGKTYKITRQGTMSNLNTNLDMYYALLIHNSYKTIDGRGATLQCTDANPTGFITNDTADIHDITVKNLNIVMDNSTQGYNPVESTTKLKIINFNKCDRVTIDNIKFKDVAGDCMEVLDGEDITISNIYVNNVVGHGISVGKPSYPSTSVIIRDCEIHYQKVYDNTISTNPVILSVTNAQVDKVNMYHCDWGFKVEHPSDGVVVSNCNFYYGNNVSSNTGYKSQGTSDSKVKNVSFIKCNVIDNISTGHAFYDTYSENTIINGCKVIKSKGTRLQGKNVTLSDCYFYNSPQSIYIRTESEGVNVENTTIKCDNADYYENAFINCQASSTQATFSNIDVISTLASVNRYISFGNSKCSNINIYAGEIVGAAKFSANSNTKLSNCNFNANQGKTYRVDCESGTTSTEFNSNAFPLGTGVCAWFSYKGVGLEISNVTHTNNKIVFTHDSATSGDYILIQLDDYYLVPAS